MSKLLAKYIKQDIGLNYNNDVVLFLKQQLHYASIDYFRCAVAAVPGLVNKQFKAVIELERLRPYPSELDVRGAILATALTHQPLKRSVLDNFKPHSIPFGNLPANSLRGLMNSPHLCKYIAFDNWWNTYEIERMYTCNSASVCIDHYISCLLKDIDNKKSMSDFSRMQSIAGLILKKPSLLSTFAHTRVDVMQASGVINILAHLDQPRFIKTVVDKNISLPRDTAIAMGEHISMHTIAHGSVSHRATKMLRLLG